ncbi:precorrin-6y C5,15-methyltransferase (decarboxylating) subunit CbiE [Kribbella kalugense]|uniref:Precorrin-6Y C5,15-methyltransferase (Decarboxylating) n=1 Tax=Kribbella kalugense TaxID=2512221 RepID=A0A4R7ZP14_9ACTN|nr:precorrin-6y C5,15-methyltransferase (decarboxylating) subunit CbiE [Kribbella kalugense]TDW19629.1 precorrin-6Y C5,15-methyltransferase (decarboxylating) [Kribbella kalugense]
MPVELVTVVGVGADGWDGLSPAARAAVEAAEVLMGSTRQLALVPSVGAVRVAWPSPLSEALPGLLSQHSGRQICVLASGDPTFHGIGTTLVRMLGADAVKVIPHPSSVSLACARLGWPQDQVQVVSLVSNPVERLHPHLQPGRRLIILSRGSQTPAEVAELLVARGYGSSSFTVLEQLGGPAERVRTAQPADWSHDVDALNVIGLLCQTDAPVMSTVPGLPDDLYENDGQLTKREVRAVTLSRLAPAPGHLLWDIGGGAGSIAIEWSRHHPSCRAIAIERDPDRAKRLERNVSNLGAAVTTVLGSAPAALAGLESPDAIFIGGGATAAGMFDACWDALKPGGRLVANGVTLETESLIAQWYKARGGDLVRLEVQRASAVGTMTGWRPAMPVTIWSLTK